MARVVAAMRCMLPLWRAGILLNLGGSGFLRFMIPARAGTVVVRRWSGGAKLGSLTAWQLLKNLKWQAARQASP